jgi:hypothetical protein
MQKKDWNQNYQELKSHVGEQSTRGELDLKRLKGPLGKWCQSQANAFKRNALSANQIKLLLDLNFPFPLETTTRVKEKDSFTTKDRILFANWLWQFENLRKLLQIKAHPFPKTTVRFPGNNNLGRWINRQNERYKNGKIEPERYQLLKGIGFPFSKTPTREDAWLTQFHHLEAYRLKHPRKWPSQAGEYPKGNRLGAWLHHQRTMWNQGALQKKRVSLFISLGVPKEVRIPEWTRQFDTLKKFLKTQAGRFPRIDEEYPEGNRLGRWAQKQRQFYKAGWLSDEKRTLLNSIGFTWDVQPDNWQQQYRYLQTFIKNHERFPRYDDKFPSGNFIGRWVCHQRDLHNAGKLEPDRHAALDRLGFIWDPRSDEWMRYFASLSKYLKQHGRMPGIHEEYPPGTKLGSWVKGQKDRHKKGLVSPERKRLLDDIGFMWPSSAPRNR